MSYTQHDLVLLHRERSNPADYFRDAAGYYHDQDCRGCEIDRLKAALTRIEAQQPKTLETLRKHGVVFDGPLGNDPKNWQHVAFTIYTDLCEVDTIARQALVVDVP